MTRSAFLSFFGLAPQTRIGPEQMRASADGVWASVGGRSGMAVIDAPLVLVVEAGVLHLRSIGKARVRNELLTASPANQLQYTLKAAANPGTLEIWRDGMHQYTTALPLPDYTITAPNQITFSAHYSGNPTVQVYANYDPT